MILHTLKNEILSSRNFFRASVLSAVPTPRTQSLRTVPYSSALDLDLRLCAKVCCNACGLRHIGDSREWHGNGRGFFYGFRDFARDKSRSCRRLRKCVQIRLVVSGVHRYCTSIVGQWLPVTSVCHAGNRKWLMILTS